MHAYGLRPRFIGLLGYDMNELGVVNGLSSLYSQSYIVEALMSSVVVIHQRPQHTAHSLHAAEVVGSDPRIESRQSR